MKLESFHSKEDKSRWKIVRRDTMEDIVCDEIVSADEDTGECCITIGDETKVLSFGFRGIALCGKR